MLDKKILPSDEMSPSLTSDPDVFKFARGSYHACNHGDCSGSGADEIIYHKTSSRISARTIGMGVVT